MISFFVNGTPKPAVSKRAFPIKGSNRIAIVDSSGKAGKDWRADIKAVALKHSRICVLIGPLAVSFMFVMTRPKGHYRTGKRAGELRDNAPEYPTGRPDVLKLARAVEDALTGIIWRDDAQIVDEEISKRYGEFPGVMVKIEEK